MSKLDPYSDQAQVAYQHARNLSNPVNRDATEAWLEELGSQFVEVWLYRDTKWFDERHIADAETLETTVSMSMGRLGVRYAIWQEGAAFKVMGPSVDQLRTLPSREAAEMLAIHGG